MVYSSSVWGSEALYPMGLWETVVSWRGGGGMAEQGVRGGKRSLWALIILNGMVSSNLSSKAMLCLLSILLRNTTKSVVFILYTVIEIKHVWGCSENFRDISLIKIDWWQWWTIYSWPFISTIYFVLNDFALLLC